MKNQVYCRRASEIRTFKDLGITDKRSLEFLSAAGITPIDLINYARFAVIDFDEGVESDLFDCLFEDFNVSDEYFYTKRPHLYEMVVPKLLESGFIREDAKTYRLLWDEGCNWGLFAEINYFKAEIYETATPLNKDKISKIFEILVEGGLPHIYAESIFCFMMSLPFSDKSQYQGYEYPNGMMTNLEDPFAHHLFRRSLTLIKKLDDEVIKRVYEVIIS